MWQRFTERARKVVFYAQEEAQRFGEGYVSTEHLLLGLVREGDSLAAQVLERLGISLSRIRGEVEKQLPRSDARPSQDMTLTPRAKRVIDLAYEEARMLSNNYIGTEHLLLGLVREGEGLAGRVLAKLGVDLEPARREVLALQEAAGEPQDLPPSGVRSPYKPPPTSHDYAGLLTILLACRQGHYVPELLAVTLLSDESTGLKELLSQLGVPYLGLIKGIEFELIGMLRQSKGSDGPTIGELFESAAEEAKALGAPTVKPAHLFLAIVADGRSPIIDCMPDTVTADALRDILRPTPEGA